MNKNLVSAALIMLLMFFISPQAHADVTYYPSPGDIEAGTELNHLIATVPAESEILSSGAMPEGISLQTESRGNEMDVYLRGTALKAGIYSCLININGSNDLLCTLHIVPSSPVISISGEQSCLVGGSAKLEVNAQISDGGSLSYIWYKSTSADGSGGEVISSESSPVFIPDTSSAGIFYYYCEVVNSNNGETASSVSAVSKLKVHESGLESISIETLPSRTEYNPGEKFNSGGLSVLLKFSDGSSKIIKDGFSLSVPSLDTPGRHSVEISYEGISCSFDINVKEAEEIVEGIGILSLPDKTVYLEGEELAVEGLSIRVYTDSGSYDLVSGFSCSPVKLDSAGSQEILVSYKDKTCTFTVDVTANEFPVGIDILTLPYKLDYKTGEELQSDGISLKLIMNTGRTEALYSDFLCSPISFDEAGSRDVTVSYKDFSCAFTVNVTEPSGAKNSPHPVKHSPAPLPEDEFSDASPSEKPSTESMGADQDSLIVYFSVSAVTLAALGVLIYALSRNTNWKFIKKLAKLFQKKEKP